MNDDDILDYGRGILLAEGRAVVAAADRLDGGFARGVRLLERCTGSVVVTGIGKAGLVARKVSATLASTGTPSHFLHPAEAMHGDLGTLRGDDVVLALSQSGESEEVVRLLPHLAARRIPVVAVTGRSSSTLGRAAAVVVVTGSVREACGLGLAPSTSTALMLALGDALALAACGLRGFTAADFAARHPGGSLGRQLALVEDAMRPLGECRVARGDDTVRAVFARPLPVRRTGAVMILGGDGGLAGLFTDSDLARLFERRLDHTLDGPIAAVMTRRPLVVAAGSRLRDAIAILEARRVSELPVVDPSGRPAGLLDIVDLVGLVSPERLAALEPGAAA
ncbi:MAG TPA: KpsF/GutQ family sugar-phosphate isomerase [Planctomycetaceae bacterium]|nr:KpsF/GutQ family sugar-phosphate isomerase [Planctomycetaceae bacterium]